MPARTCIRVVRSSRWTGQVNSRPWKLKRFLLPIGFESSISGVRPRMQVDCSWMRPKSTRRDRQFLADNKRWAGRLACVIGGRVDLRAKNPIVLSR